MKKDTNEERLMEIMAAENECVHFAIQYLKKQTNQSRALMEIALEEYVKMLANPEIHYRIINKIIYDLENGDLQAWIRMRAGSSSLFQIDLALNSDFLEAARIRNIQFGTSN